MTLPRLCSAQLTQPRGAALSEPNDEFGLRDVLSIPSTENSQTLYASDPTASLMTRLQSQYRTRVCVHVFPST